MFSRLRPLILRGFAAKKKKEVEVQMLTNDIVNIFKDRTDPEPVLLQNMPLEMHKAFFSQNYGRSIPFLRGDLNAHLETVDMNRLGNNIKSEAQYNRNYYKHQFQGGKNKKRDQTLPQKMFPNDIFTEKLQEMQREEQEQRKRLQEQENEQ